MKRLFTSSINQDQSSSITKHNLKLNTVFIDYGEEEVPTSFEKLKKSKEKMK